MTPEERAARADSRLPFRLLERWTMACVEARADLSRAASNLLASIRGICAAAANSSGALTRLTRQGHGMLDLHHTQTLGNMVDRRFSFWIANLFDYASLLQWLVGNLNDQESSAAAQAAQGHTPSPRLLALLQLRMDVTRLVEHLYRAWLGDLMRFFGRLCIPALLDYQGLAGFAATGEGDSPRGGGAPTSSNALKNIIMPLAKLASARFAELETERSIDDLVGCLEDLADATEACHLQGEIVVQLFGALMAHISASAFNQLLIRKNYATWKRGIQIQFNISRLEEWAASLHAKNPGYYFSMSHPASPCGGGPTRQNNHQPGSSPPTISPTAATGGSSSVPAAHSPIWQIEPLIQAVKLLQLAKTTVASDLELLFEACPRLSVSQIRKILSIYVPDAFEDGPVSQEVLQALTQLIVNGHRERTADAFAEPKAQEMPLQLSVRPLAPTNEDPHILESQLPDTLSQLLTRS